LTIYDINKNKQIQNIKFNIKLYLTVPKDVFSKMSLILNKEYEEVILIYSEYPNIIIIRDLPIYFLYPVKLNGFKMNTNMRRIAEIFKKKVAFVLSQKF